MSQHPQRAAERVRVADVMRAESHHAGRTRGHRSAGPGRGIPIRVPDWVKEMIAGADGCGQDHPVGVASEMRVTERTAQDARWVAVELPGARAWTAEELRRGAQRAYAMHRRIAGDVWHPVRIWNFIPGITEPLQDGLDRYKAFNLGRHDEVHTWFGDERREFEGLPAATGVGHAGDDLVIHMLMLREPPAMVENPRQRPAFRYTKLYGPKPPCFSRASIVEHSGQRAMLIAGTASILGETSAHRDLARDQVLETLANLEALIRSVVHDESEALSRLDHVRAYSPDPANDAMIRKELTRRLSGRPFELVRADLCRAELIVEIEGTASLGAAPNTRTTRHAPER